MVEVLPEAYLETVIGSKPKRFELEPGVVCRIGRDSKNTIVLADNQVSRNHAIVQRTQTGQFYLTDLGSRNGTFVNQRRATAPVILQPGDQITIGKQEFLFHGPCEPSPALSMTARETMVDFAQRLITVLVADIRDFTGLSRRLPEDRLSEVISTFMREAGTVLSEEGAWAQKYIGDAVMAIWVHGGEGPDVREIFAVFRALAKVFRIAAGLQSQFDLEEPIRIGAGINTGLASVGNMGSDGWSDYTALSDAVNLSFRLESATKEIGCDLALGWKTYEFLARQTGAGNLLFEAHTLPLKGYREPAQIYTGTEASVGILLDDFQRKLPGETAREARV